MVGDFQDLLGFSLASLSLLKRSRLSDQDQCLCLGREGRTHWLDVLLAIHTPLFAVSSALCVGACNSRTCAYTCN